MKLVPSIDLQAGRSRLVFWPGASTGTGAPTDRPERIARHFVELGAPLIHLVDLDGAGRGVPVNTAAVGRVAREVAVPLQLAGGVDGPEQIELAFASGATRVVVPLWAVVESPDNLAACLRIAGDWLAVGLDGRPERLADYPWRSGTPLTLEQVINGLASEGVRRLVVSHWREGPLDALLELAAGHDVEVQLAGGVDDPAVLVGLADAGVAAVIAGEALFNGSIDYSAARSLDTVTSRGRIS
jgi:phosphoribosylformimino-5-aminoimidazole carboxamide ribotide isomerase